MGGGAWDSGAWGFVPQMRLASSAGLWEPWETPPSWAETKKWGEGMAEEIKRVERGLARFGGARLGDAPGLRRGGGFVI